MLVSQSQTFVAQSAYVWFPVYLASLLAILNKHPFATEFLYVYPALNVYICHLKPPPHVDVSQRPAIRLKTACAIATHPGVPEGGFSNFSSAAVMAAMAQKP